MSSKLLPKYTFLLIFFLGCAPSPDKLVSLYKRTSYNYEAELKNNPANFNLRLKLAKFYYDFKDYQRAKALLEKRQEGAAKILLAKTYARLKDYRRAYEIFEQAGEAGDGEYLYFYGLTCEEKNLFPRAVEIYKKVKPPFKELAEERIKTIRIKIKEQLPAQITALLKEKESFLSGINKEETAILLADEAIEIKEDNTSVSTIHIVEKVLKEKGKDAGEVNIGYDSTHERVELEYARTVTPQGRTVYAGKENIRDVSKYLDFPLYSNARVFIISMPAVEVGSIIDYKARIYSSQLVNKDDFTFIYHLQERSPIGKAKFKLIIPAERKVYFKFLNENYAGKFKLSPRLKEEAEKKIYLWEFADIPPIIPEENMPSASMINPAIVISSFSSWKEIYAWWDKLFKDKLSLNKEMREFLKELVKDYQDDLEKAKRIYRFCAQNIRYVGVEYGRGGYEPHHAREVFWNRYGDCKDQAILLIALLREAGLKAYPVLIPTRQAYPIKEDFPSLNFNHAIVAILYKGEFVFMDATSPTTSFFNLPLDDQDREVLVFLDEGYKILKTPLIKDNRIIYDTKIDIDDNEDAYIERKVATEGFFAAWQRFYFKYTHPQNIKDDIQKKIMGISPFSRLRSYKIENTDDFDKPPLLQYTFSAKKVLSPAKDLRILPKISDIEIPPAYAGKRERRYPIEFKGIFKKISKLKVHMPAHLKVKYLPANQILDTPWFMFKARYEAKGNTLDAYKEFAVKKKFVEKEEYGDFKSNLEKVFYLLKEEIILEKEAKEVKK